MSRIAPPLVTGLVVLALIFGSVRDQRTQKRALHRLQGDGAGLRP